MFNRCDSEKECAMRRIYDWTVVVPWSFGKMLTPVIEPINVNACQEPTKTRRLNAHKQD